MPSRTLPRLLLAAIVLAVPVRSGRAEPVRWYYNTQITPYFVRPDAGPVTPSPYPWPGDAWVSFQPMFGDLTTTSPIVLGNAFATGWLPLGGPATFKRQPIQMEMLIFDSMFFRTEATFSTYYYLDGTISGQGANLTITPGEASKTFQLGPDAYRINLGMVTLSGPLSEGSPIGATGPIHSYSGVIGATVQVNNTPEPSTLVLLGVAASAAGLVYHRRRKAGPDAAA